MFMHDSGGESIDEIFMSKWLTFLPKGPQKSGAQLTGSLALLG